MRSRLVFILIIVLQLFMQVSLAQTPDLTFHRIEGPHGKPLGKIRNVTQDPHGYMWFAGEDFTTISSTVTPNQAANKFPILNQELGVNKKKLTQQPGY